MSGIPLLRVQNDAEWHTVIRKGRFPVPRELGSTPAELMGNPMGRRLVGEAQERMIEGLRARGQVLIEGGFRQTREGGDTFKLEGPVPHIPFSENGAPDRIGAMPDVRDRVRFLDWEHREKELTATRLDAAQQEQAFYRDWFIRAVFRKLHPVSFRKHVPHQHEFVASRLRAAALAGKSN